MEKSITDKGKKNVVCWGVGWYFENHIIDFLKETSLINRVRYLVDSDDSKQGKIYECEDYHFSIKSPECLEEDKEVEVCIVCTLKKTDEIIALLEENRKYQGIEFCRGDILNALYVDKKIISVTKCDRNYRKNPTMTIPKVIHCCWFSGEEIPDFYKQCMESWKKYCPDYKIKMWTLDNYNPKNCRFFQEAVREKKWAFASDYARVDIIYQHGGIYLDMDVELVRCPDDLLYNDAYMGFEDLNYIECGSGFGAKKNHPIFKEIRECYENIPFVLEDGSYDRTTCPARYTPVMLRHGLKQDGSFQHVEDITVYPFEFLSAKSFSTGIVYQTDYTYSIHHHNGSWVPESEKEMTQKRYAMVSRLLEKNS